MSFPIGHIGISVTDLTRSTEFYSSVFGLARIGGSDDGARRFAFLGSGEQLVLTLWEQSDRGFDARAAGLHHLSFQAEGIEAVREAEVLLRGRGVKLYHDGVVPHAEGRASGGLFFEDPDGTRLELFAPTGADTAAAPFTDAPTCGFF